MDVQWAKMFQNVSDSVEELIYWATKCPCRTPLFSPVATWAKTVDLRVTAWPWVRFEPVFWFRNKDLDPCLTWAFPLLLCFTAFPWEGQLDRVQQLPGTMQQVFSNLSVHTICLFEHKTVTWHDKKYRRLKIQLWFCTSERPFVAAVRWLAQIIGFKFLLIFCFVVSFLVSRMPFKSIWMTISDLFYF